MEDKAPILKENIMGTMPVHRLLITISLPMIISMLIQSLYNVVDSYFVAKISEDALTAVQLAFPVQYLMIAVSTGTAVGINALLSRKLGQGDQGAVNKAAENGVFLALLSSAAFVLIGVFLAKPFMSWQTDAADIIESGSTYLSICCICSIGIFFGITFGRLLQSTGRTLLSMIGQIAGAVTNIVLDPILIFGLVGMPKMGIAGAAAATVIGQFVGALVDIILNYTKNPEIQMKLRRFKPEWAVIKEIYVVGIPAVLNNAILSVMMFGMNAILIGFSTSATAVLGVYSKLQSFIFMPIIGLNNGMIPILAYNYGAKSKERITKTVKLAAVYASCFALAGLLLFQIFPKPILALFIEEPATMVLGVKALRVISLGFLCGGITFVFCSVFQAMRKAHYSLIVQSLRQLVLILPAAYLLSLTGEVNNVWWSFPIADFIALGICIAMYAKMHKEHIEKIG